MYKIFKRLADFFISLCMFPFFMLLYFIVAIAIKLDDGGPVLYKGDRLGINGKPYPMYKFRSMRVNAPDIRLEDGSTYNGKDDPRVTKVGNFLRRTSIDEIPQLINILLGHMAFIGPRPDPVDWLFRYSDEEKKLLSVKPGITGYNQAYYRNGNDGAQKTYWDVYYAVNISLKLDIKIFIKTIFTVLGGHNLFKKPEEAIIYDKIALDEVAATVDEDNQYDISLITPKAETISTPQDNDISSVKADNMIINDFNSDNISINNNIMGDNANNKNDNNSNNGIKNITDINSIDIENIEKDTINKVDSKTDNSQLEEEIIKV